MTNGYRLIRRSVGEIGSELSDARTTIQSVLAEEDENISALHAKENAKHAK
jgi:hypothetical protein